jgi:hypothetical protein
MVLAFFHLLKIIPYFPYNIDARYRGFVAEICPILQ